MPGKSLHSCALYLVLSLGMVGLCLAQAQLQLGDSLPGLTLNDQHDKPASIAPGTRQLLLAADNEGNGLIGRLLDQAGPEWLQQTDRVYLADIHRMPALIARLFALPALREKPYRIVLGREEADLAMFPRQKACVTVLAVQGGRLGRITFACNDRDLQQAVAD